MQNKSLARDYLKRAEARLSAVKALQKEESWADVVRESQQVVELALKALLRHANVEVPRIHDVSGVLLEERRRLPAGIQGGLEELCEISKSLRRDRELSFYGSEDLTPSEFYRKKDGDRAAADARKVVEAVKKAMG
jgi:HEPN domain-containing protein